MQQKRYLTRPEQFKSVYDNGSSIINRLIVLKIMRNGMDVSRYGISINSKVGGAVVRNRIKRRLREILRKISIEKGWDFVIIARPAAAKVNYQELKNSVDHLLAKANLLVDQTGKNNTEEL